MDRRRARRAFTIVELLVALTLMGVAAAGLTASLAGERRLRALAAAHDFAAARVRERLEVLASLPCAAEASGSELSARGAERWHAWASQSAWQLTDSIELGRPSSRLLIEARVPCPD